MSFYCHVVKWANLITSLFKKETNDKALKTNEVEVCSNSKIILCPNSQYLSKNSLSNTRFPVFAMSLIIFQGTSQSKYLFRLFDIFLMDKFQICSFGKWFFMLVNLVLIKYFPNYQNAIFEQNFNVVTRKCKFRRRSCCKTHL